MKKKLISILITNHNKNIYLYKSLKKCFDQNYKKFEVIIYDDRSTDGSIKTIRKFKKINLILNKRNFLYPPLNQLEGIIAAFKKSKGSIICLMDADDYFGKNKLNIINDYFDQNINKNILFDIPFSKKKIFIPKIKKHSYSIWPTIIPTSGITLRRKTMKKFIELSQAKKLPHLEVDSRIVIFAYHYLREMNFINKKITYYNVDENGISSKYKKFSKLWWYKRLHAFTYLKYILKKRKKKFIISLDFIITRMINYILK